MASELQLSEPVFTADPQHRYFLRYQPHPSYDDTITIEMVDDGRPFLKKITSTTVDKTRDIAIDLAKAAAFSLNRFQSFRAEDARLLAQATLDPSDPKSVSDTRDELNEAMRRFIGERRKELGCASKPPPVEPDVRAACIHLGTLVARNSAHHAGKTDGEAYFMLSVVAPTPVAATRSTDCSVGVCYRPKIPYLIAYSVAGVTDTKMVELPNGTEPIAIDVSRAFLVKKVQEVEFDKDGFLNRIAIKKDSELLAAATLPLDILGAVAEGLQLRINLTQKNTEIANKEAELIKKRAKLKTDQNALQARIQAAASQRTRSAAARPLDVAETLSPAQAPPIDPTLLNPN